MERNENLSNMWKKMMVEKIVKVMASGKAGKLYQCYSYTETQSYNCKVRDIKFFKRIE